MNARKVTAQSAATVPASFALAVTLPAWPAMCACCTTQSAQLPAIVCSAAIAAVQLVEGNDSSKTDLAGAIAGALAGTHTREHAKPAGDRSCMALSLTAQHLRQRSGNARVSQAIAMTKKVGSKYMQYSHEASDEPEMFAWRSSLNCASQGTVRHTHRYQYSGSTTKTTRWFQVLQQLRRSSAGHKSAFLH